MTTAEFKQQQLVVKNKTYKRYEELGKKLSEATGATITLAYINDTANIYEKGLLVGKNPGFRWQLLNPREQKEIQLWGASTKLFNILKDKINY